jgi:hypothetical protein
MIIFPMPNLLAIAPIVVFWTMGKILGWIAAGAAVAGAVYLAYKALQSFVEWAVENKLPQKISSITSGVMKVIGTVYRVGQQVKMVVEVLSFAGNLYNLATQWDDWWSVPSDVRQQVDQYGSYGEEYTL